MSWEARSKGVVSFYIRRFFRIAPMFWIGIAFFIWLDNFSPRYWAPNGINWFDVFLTTIFVHGWHPETINSVVPGGWSIAVEMMFYLVLPILMLFVRGWRSALAFCIAANFIAKYSYAYFWTQRGYYWPDISDDLVSAYLNLWFPTQLPVFAIGFLLFFLVRDGRGQIPKSWLIVLMSCSVLAMIALALNPKLANISVLKTIFFSNYYAAYGMVFGIFAFCLADGAAKWLANAPIRYIGKISFSAYLWHFAILGMIAHSEKLGLYPLKLMVEPRGFGFFLWFFPLIVLLTVLFSTLTYRLIERPFIRIGNNLIDSLTSKKACPAAVTSS